MPSLAQRLRDEGREIGRNEGIMIGKMEGKMEGKRETAMELLKDGVDINTIYRCTRVPLEELEKMMRSIRTH